RVPVAAQVVRSPEDRDGGWGVAHDSGLLAQLTDRALEGRAQPGVLPLQPRDVAVPRRLRRAFDRVDPGLEGRDLPEEVVPLGGQGVHALDQRRNPSLDELRERLAHASIRRKRAPGTVSRASNSRDRYASVSGSVNVRSNGWRIARSVIATSPFG